MKRLAYLILLLTIVSGCSEEEIKIDIANCTYSRTLPVLFINTEENKPVVSKEEYVNATYYLETFDLNGYEPRQRSRTTAYGDSRTRKFLLEQR